MVAPPTSNNPPANPPIFENPVPLGSNGESGDQPRGLRDSRSAAEREMARPVPSQQETFLNPSEAQPVPSTRPGPEMMEGNGRHLPRTPSASAPTPIGEGDSIAPAPHRGLTSRSTVPFPRSEDVPGTQALHRKKADAEATVEMIVQGPKPWDRNRLEQKVTEAFEARQEILRAELAHFQDRLAQLNQQVQAREKQKKKIIERRMAELQSPHLQWDPAFTQNGGAARPVPSNNYPGMSGESFTQPKRGRDQGHDLAPSLDPGSLPASAIPAAREVAVPTNDPLIEIQPAIPSSAPANVGPNPGVPSNPPPSGEPAVPTETPASQHIPAAEAFTPAPTAADPGMSVDDVANTPNKVPGLSPVPLNVKKSTSVPSGIIDSDDEIPMRNGGTTRPVGLSGMSGNVRTGGLRKTEQPPVGNLQGDLGRWQGDWRLVRAEMDGKAMTREQQKAMSGVRVQGNRVTLFVGDLNEPNLEGNEALLEINSFPKIKEFNLSGLNATMGIYDFRDEQLWISFYEAGSKKDGKRPSSFVTSPGSRQFTYRFERKAIGNRSESQRSVATDYLLRYPQFASLSYKTTESEFRSLLLENNSNYSCSVTKPNKKVYQISLADETLMVTFVGETCIEIALKPNAAAIGM